MTANYFTCPQMETVKHIYTFMSDQFWILRVENDLKGSGFLSVHLHPSSSAQQQRKENMQSRYLNKMDRYGTASLNSLISAPCSLRWSKAKTMHVLCLKISFSFCVRAVYCMTEKVLDSLLFCSFYLCQGESLCDASIYLSACLPVC